MKLATNLFMLSVMMLYASQGFSQVTEEMINEALLQTKIKGALSGAQMYKGDYITPFETNAKAYRIFQKRIFMNKIKGEWKSAEDYLSVSFEEKYISIFRGRDEVNPYDSWTRTYYIKAEYLKKEGEFFATDDNDAKAIVKLTPR